MTTDYDPTLEHLREIGQRNVEIMDLVAKHCTHAKVELAPFMGRGMAEEMLHLPVNARTITCPHAARPAGGAIQLEWVAVDFYRQNCIGCGQRVPRGIPNLKTHLEDLERRAAEERTERDEAERRRAAERDGRRERRRRLVEGEPYTTQDEVAVLDAIDAEEPDDDACARLRAVAEHAPEIFTAPAATALLETARATRNAALLATVRILAHAGRVAPDPAISLALEVLAAAPIHEAGHIIVDFHELVPTDALVPALDSLLILAGRVGPYSPGERQADPKPVVAAYQRAPLIVLERIEQWLAAEEDYRSSHGAQAAEAVIGYEPGTATVLASRLLDRLARVRGGVMRHLSMEGPAARIEDALTAALRAKPNEVRALIEARALALDADQRETLVGAFDGVFRDAVRESGTGLDAEVGKMVVEFCFARLKADWGPEVSWRAADTLERVAEAQPGLLAGQALRVWAALLDEASWKQPAASAVADPRPDYERILVGMTALNAHDARLGRLRRTLDALIASEPGAVANAAFTVLEERDLGGEDVEHMRAEAVRLLGPLGCQPRMLRAVLPHLYTALLGTDVRMRALAIDAWAHIKAEGSKHELPAELDELLPALLRDTYVYPRQQLVAALRTIGVRDEHLELAALSAVEVGTQAKYSHHIEEAVNALRWLASRTSDGTLARNMRRATLKLAERLDDYDLRDFVVRASGEFRLYPGYTDLVLRSLVSEPVMSSFADNEQRELELLWRAPPRFLASRIDGVRQAARVHLPLVPHRALWYVEALQQAGLFSEAADLAEMVVNEVPTTRQYAPRRSYAEAVQAAARFELAVARGDSAAVRTHLEDWRLAIKRYATTLAEAGS